MSNYKFETIQIHAGQENPDPATDARAVPIYQTAAFVFPSSKNAAARFALTEPGNIYTRIMNPTCDVFEKRIAALENGVGALSTSSGQSASLYAVLNIVRAGEHIITDKQVYGGTVALFTHTTKDMGIETTFVDMSIPSHVENAIKENTRAVFFESMANPSSNLVDIEAISAIAHKHGIPVIVDNTFASPYYLRPLDMGADIVVHSATKFINGHGTGIAGVIIDGGKFDWAASDKFPGLTKPCAAYNGIVFTEIAGNAAYIVKARTTLLRDIGACLGPFDAFLLLQGLETLSLRMERHVENALKTVDYLSTHPKIERVNHPAMPGHRDNALYRRYFPKGAASIFTIDLKGDRDTTAAFVERLKLFSNLANVADVKSLIIHPATTTHSQLSEEMLKGAGITPTTVRLSIGTEHIDDIIGDLAQALG
ncbi:MAG: O-acetylhomoserine aminocarboxypropyltransferase/cysteine synthase [Treponema sp.]|nr:O-acetylhomoserine aminocarboxypropyltransferase/cysteine synthase [Treponema sp.]